MEFWQYVKKRTGKDIYGHYEACGDNELRLKAVDQRMMELLAQWMQDCKPSHGDFLRAMDDLSREGL